MHFQEWALPLFTVLTQASIGAFILIAGLRLVSRDEAMDGAYRKAVLTLIPVAAVGLIASLLHLGRPLLAMTAMKHLSTSWLSREIFFSGGFVVMLIVSGVLDRMPGIRKVVDVLTAVAGVASVVSMIMVYQVTARPAWQGWGTAVAFAGTTLVIGMGLAAGLIALYGRENPQVAANLNLLLGGAVISLILVVAAYPIYLASLSGAGTASAQTLKLLGSTYSVALILRWVLTLAGGLVPLVFAWRRLATGKVPAGLLYTALAFVVAGELIGRYLFYVTGISLGIGIGS